MNNGKKIDKIKGLSFIHKNKIISLGFNGFASGIKDTKERYNNRSFKYPAVIHAEENSLLFAKQDLNNCTIYVWPMPPCARCASKIIQVGIDRIVTVNPDPDKLERWKGDFEIAEELYKDANIIIDYLRVE